MPLSLPPPIRLEELLERAGRGDVPAGWLYLPESWGTWNADTLAYMLDAHDDEEHEHFEAEADDIGYVSTIDNQTLEGIVLGTRSCLKSDAFSVRLEALIYYYRFDAFLPRVGAPDPPPAEEVIRRIDRQFYDALGPESPATSCRHPNCTRGTVKFSVFCRVHQFEQVKKKPCPFNE